MKLCQLMDIQQSGALNVRVDQVNNVRVVGGIQITNEQAVGMAAALGWSRYSFTAVEAIARTNSWVKGLRTNLVENHWMESGDVTFMSTRRSDTEQYIERVNIKTEKADFTIIKGAPGVGGAYAVYEKAFSLSQPRDTFSSMKQVCEFLNNI